MHTEELKELYMQTDLEFHYVHRKCYELIDIKSKRISDDNILFWFRQMLRDRWTKAIFDRQFERLIKKEIKNDMIDYSDWCSAQIMLPEFEIGRRARMMHDDDIKSGERYFRYIEENGIENIGDFPPAAIEQMRLAVISELRMELTRKRSQAYEQLLNKIRNEEKEKIREKRKTLRKLDTAEREAVINMLFEHEIMEGKLMKHEKEAFIKDIQVLQQDVMSLEEKTGKDILTLIREKSN